MKKNILIVEDSPYFRTSLIERLSHYKDINILGYAADGISAVRMFAELRPDVVLLDLMLPKMNGDAVAESIMSINPTPIILMTSLSDFEIEKSFILNIDYFVDIIKKPLEIDDEFLQKVYIRIKNSSKIQIKNTNTQLGLHKKQLDNYPKKEALESILVIGGSTGGPKVLKSIIPLISNIKNLPVIVANHYEFGFEVQLKDWLSGLSNKQTALITDCLPVEDKVYIAPTAYNFVIEKNMFKLTPIDKQQAYYPSINNVYKSIASAYKNKCIIFQITGMGYDGLDGIKYAKDVGAKIIVQDPETAVAPSMPKCALSYADHIIKPEEIIDYL
ncbi:chemotaxis protein CheB [Deferribacter thermophilus]|uniref:chemotaxis protein CheB n=1 Tax=Deferribacter thermophilus TaxID=53573 RepID=UPI003C215BD1